MIGALFILLVFVFGLTMVDYFFSDLIEEALKFKGFSGREVGMKRWLVIGPAGFLVGNLVIGWLVYLISYLFRFTSEPLVWGNFISIVLIFLWLGFYWFKFANRFAVKRRKDLLVLMKNWLRENWLFLLFIGVFLGVSLFLMYYTFRIDDEGNLLIGATVYSDFGPHLALIRSFSLGKNFPTIYPHFPNGNIRYHFMFDFWVGNLEYLGLRLDHAFSFLSALTLTGFGLLLFSFASLLSGVYGVGVLTLVLWFLRSSLAFFIYIFKADSWRNIGEAVFGVRRFIGETTHEDWGLWAQNVYVNQRHLSLALGVLILVLILVLPLIEKSAGGWWGIKQWLFGRLGWLPNKWKRVLLLGLLLGMLGFWNGAVVIGGLIILMILTIFSYHRLEFVLMFLIAGILIYLQKMFFIGFERSIVSPTLVIGFLAEKRDLMSIVSYYVELLGVFWIVLPFSLILIRRKMLLMVLAFLGPFVWANMVRLTPAPAVNHKYILLSVMFLNIFVAYFLYRLFIKRKWATILIGVLLLFQLTATGIVDIFSLVNLNKRPMIYSQNGRLMKWVVDNTDPRAIFLLHSWPVSHPVLLAGRSVFYGWPYFSWSIGYDNREREKLIKKIYLAQNPDTLTDLLKGQTEIDFLVYNKDADNIETAKLAFKLVYEDEKEKFLIFEVER